MEPLNPQRSKSKRQSNPLFVRPEIFVDFGNTFFITPDAFPPHHFDEIIRTPRSKLTYPTKSLFLLNPLPGTPLVLSVIYHPLHAFASQKRGCKSFHLDGSFPEYKVGATYPSHSKVPDFRRSLGTSVTLKFTFLYAIYDIATLKLCNCAGGFSA